MGSAAALAIAPRVIAEPPSSPAAGADVAAQPAVERLVRISASQTIRLRPVSPSFDRTIVRAIAADPDGDLVAVAGDDHAIRIMEVQTLRTIATLQGHADLIQSLQFNHRGNQLISTGNDGRLILWSRRGGFRRSQVLENDSALACVRFAPDDQEIAAVGFDSRVYLIGQTPAGRRPRVECDCTDLRAIGYREDGKLLAVAGRSGSLHLFERASNELIGQYPIHSGRVHELRFVEASPVCVSVGEDGAVVMFDTDQRQVVGRMPVTGSKLFAVCVLDQKHLAVAGSDNVIHLLDVVKQEVVERLEDHSGSVTALASSGSLLFSGGYDATLRRWNLSGIQGERIAERQNPLDR
jgi:WD40 repeat protein